MILGRELSLVWCQLTYNARSMKNKIPELQAVIDSMKLSLVAITETWLDTSIPDAMLFDSHIVFRKDRNRRGGGILLAISNFLQPTPVHVGDLDADIEIVFAEFIINSERWLRGVYYRPPSDVTSIDLLENVLNSLNVDCYAGFLLMGDFNIN